MIPLYKPFIPSDLLELNTILYSGHLAYGEYGKKFEEKLKHILSNEQIISINSFNSAVLVALTTLGVRPGDEVIASPMACLASTQPFITMGVKVIWADVDPQTGTLDPKDVKCKITSSTKAIFHNHFCGYPGYIDEINRLGKEHGIPVVDDAIEAFGSKYKGKNVGSLASDLTVFSFQAVRIPTTIDGGAISFHNKDYYELSLRVRDSGIDRRYFRDELGEINSNYDITTAGFGATMSEINSYIGLKQADVIDELIEKQRMNANSWNKILDNTDFIPLGTRNNETLPNYWVYGILSNDKSETIKKFRSLGYYASGVHYPNNYYSIFGKQELLKGVEEFYTKFVALPCGWWTKIDVEKWTWK